MNICRSSSRSTYWQTFILMKNEELGMKNLWLPSNSSFFILHSYLFILLVLHLFHYYLEAFAVYRYHCDTSRNCDCFVV